MTYCVGLLVDTGLVMLSDSRTNAGVDQINTFRKMATFHTPGERILVLMSAGNLAVTQAVLHVLREAPASDAAPERKAAVAAGGPMPMAGAPAVSAVKPSARAAAPVAAAQALPAIYTAKDMFAAARVIGDALRTVHDRDAEALQQQGHEFHAAFILGGQIRGEDPRLFNIYAAGNFIESSNDTPYFQIGESKYGKPIIDRVISRTSSLSQAAKCALISMDSTIRSNLSVGPPLDLAIIRRDELKLNTHMSVDADHPYFKMIRTRWGLSLREVFSQLPDPGW